MDAQPSIPAHLSEHGGTDSGPAVRFDFSSNANALGPNPVVVKAVMHAPRDRYPDPRYHALREQLAAFHGVSPLQVVVGASGSELIWRLTTLHRHAAPSAHVLIAPPTFSEYERAARALQRSVGLQPALPGLDAALQTHDLVWMCVPNNPTGTLPEGSDLDRLVESVHRHEACLVADLAYWPLQRRLPPALPQGCVQLWSPNKAHGLTGVRGAYLVLPAHGRAYWVHASALDALAPSWVLGSDGVALLEAQTLDAAQAWLAHSHSTLMVWLDQLAAALAERGWEIYVGTANFLLARPPLETESEADPGAPMAAWLSFLRGRGIKLRDARSFGLPGWLRLSAQRPQAVQALTDAWDEYELRGELKGLP